MKNILRSAARGPKWTLYANAFQQWFPAMLVAQNAKIALVIVLALVSIAGATGGDARLVAGTDKITLWAAPNPVGCAPCEECAPPCRPSVVCGAVCTSLGLLPEGQITLSHYSLRIAVRPNWQVRSAELRIPTPPPRPSHSV